MNDHEKERLYSDALYLWGGGAQLTKLTEECGELIAATARFQVQGHTDITVTSLKEEAADVEIMLEQLRFILGDLVTDRFKEEKLKRLRARVDEGLKNQ